jgi:acyl-CoA synthetase (NDP forming)
VDVSQAQFRGIPTLLQAIDLVVADTTSDVVLIQEDVEILLPIYSRRGLDQVNESIIELGRRQRKPIVIVLPPGSVEAERLEIEQTLLAASMPVFYSMERAARAICRLNEYSCQQEPK